jgi:type II secretory pathway pseudopilin PulG
MWDFRSTAGFSLIEALIATALLAGAIAALAQLVMRSAEQTTRAEHATIASVLAQAKLEELRALPFRFDANGVLIEDPALAPSAADSLDADSPPHVEALDRFGQPVAAGEIPVYIRRWSIAVAPLDPDTIVLAACVLPAGIPRLTDTCVWGIRVRRP